MPAVASASVVDLTGIVGPLRPYWYTAVFFAASSLPFLAAKSAFLFPTKQWLAPSALLSASLFFTVAHLMTARCSLTHRGLLLSVLECPFDGSWNNDKPGDLALQEHGHMGSQACADGSPGLWLSVGGANRMHSGRAHPP